jgi:16S rRNA processing protein RimM
MRQTKWVLIGEIVGPHGNRGEVKVIPHTEFPERFEQMEKVRLFRPDIEEPFALYPLEGARWHKGALMLKLQGIEDISGAEKLRNMLIKVGLDELMPLPPGRYYIFQLIGLECVTPSGQKLGTITDILQTGANDVYVVKPYPGVTKQREILLPVIEDVVLEIDLDGKRVVVELLDGLLD